MPENKVYRTAAIDAGFDALKGYFGGLNGRFVYIPNVVMELERHESLATNTNVLDELHVKVTSSALKKGGTYAVGTLASRFEEADQSSTFDRKGESDQTIIMILTAIAYDAALEDEENDVINVTRILSTGLPIDESKIEGSRESFAKKIKDGIHQVEFMETPELKGKKVNIKFEEVYVNTEGHAAMVDMTMDDNYKKRNEDLFKKNVLFDDMGGNTTDFAVIRKGNIDNEYSTGLPQGISNTLDDIIAAVHVKYRFPFKTRRELIACITNPDEDERYTIRPQAKAVSIKDIVDEHLHRYALRQYKELERVWMKVGDLQQVVAVGGTASLIKNHFEKINKEKAGYPVTFRESSEDSIRSIAKAYQKLLVIRAKRDGYNVTR